jgi:hypothetical protein
MKRHIGLTVMVILAFSIIGCAGGRGGNTSDEESQSQTPPPVEIDAPLLSEGETVTIDGECEFHVDYVNISENPEFYYEAETGKTYVDFCITYKNLTDHTVSAGDILEGTLVYSGYYKYGGDDVAAGGDGRAWSPAHWIDLEPSKTGQVHYFFKVSKEVQDEGRMVELDMGIRGNEYRVVVREGEKGLIPAGEDTDTSDNVSDENVNASGKGAGELADGEVVITENAKFYVEYSKFTKEVTPPAPGSIYAYYKAEDGKTYIDVCIVYTNLSTEKIAVHKAVSADLEQAEAQAEVVEIGKRSNFDNSGPIDIIPLCTEYVHYIFQVPEELETNSEKVTISFKIDGKRYTYSVK